MKTSNEINNENVLENQTENNVIEINPSLFRQSIKWVFVSCITLWSFAAGIWTLLPTAILPWGASKVNMMGYISHCSFAPVSTIGLFIITIIGLVKAIKIMNKNPLSYIILAAVSIGVLVGMIVNIDTGMFLGAFVAAIVGVVITLLLIKYGHNRSKVINDEFIENG